MSTQKKALGRGLGALIPSRPAAEPVAAPPAPQQVPGSGLALVPISQISPNPYQPRKTFNDASIEELSRSVREHGIIQPLVVTKIGDDKYRLIAGERRFRAAQKAGLEAVPVVVKETMTDGDVLQVALIENIQREDLNPLEEASALQRLIDEFHLTHAQAADAVGRSRAAVSNLLRLLELPDDIRVLVETRALEMGHARALLTLAPQAAVALARQAVEHGWSVREVEHRVQQLSAGKVTPNRARKAAPGRPQADIAALERELSESLGARVNVLHGRGGKGRLVIHYGDLEALDGVLERLRAKD